MNGPYFGHAEVVRRDHSCAYCLDSVVSDQWGEHREGDSNSGDKAADSGYKQVRGCGDGAEADPLGMGPRTVASVRATAAVAPSGMVPGAAASVKGDEARDSPCYLFRLPDYYNLICKY